jgi:ABC-2 type transport system ATP-binding protein
LKGAHNPPPVAKMGKRAGRVDGGIISTKNILKQYDTVTALNSVSLKVPHGATGLLGPNGAGKSTLIRILIGLVQPTSGTGRILDMDIKESGLQIRQRIGYMPEHDCLILDMDAVSLCTYMGQMMGMAKTDAMQRAHEVLHYLGVGDERYRKIGTYSTGMRQKIKLAQALVHDPELLLLDEPTNGLDPKGRDEMLNLIKALAVEERKNILLSSHLLPDVEYVCENIIVLNAGEVLKQGNIKEMLIASKTVLNVRIRGVTEVLESFVKGLSGLGYKAELGKGGNVRVDAEQENRVEGAYTAIMKAASGCGCQVRYVSQSVKSLEDLFIEVVRGEKEVV